MKRIGWINLLVGVWLIIAAFAVRGGATSSVITINESVLGILLIASSVWIMTAAAPPAGAAWFQMICGLWLIISPFLLRYGAARNAMTNAVVMGIVAIVVALVESRVAMPRPA
jgi:uncharacterized membrane protein